MLEKLTNCLFILFKVYLRLRSGFHKGLFREVLKAKHSKKKFLKKTFEKEIFGNILWKDFNLLHNFTLESRKIIV